MMKQLTMIILLMSIYICMPIMGQNIQLNGDVNLDGVVNSADIVELVKIIMKENSQTPSDNITAKFAYYYDEPLGIITKNRNIYILDNKSTTPLIITCNSKYSTNDGSYPTVKLYVGDYSSLSYKVGRKDEYVFQQWRIPPIINGMEKARISFAVPSGVTLDISDFSVQNEQLSLASNTDIGFVPNIGLRLDAHLGFQKYAPQNTKSAFLMAAQCGYKACITNPIVTSDGVIVCYHEDNTVLNEVGSTSKVKLSASQVHNMSYTDLIKNYEVRNNYFVEKIPTLEEFFSICAMTGMQPVLSVHPALTKDQWESIKTLLMKYGILQNLRIKASSIGILQTAYSVLGDSIQGYMQFLGTTFNIETICSTFNKTIATNNVVKIIEFKTGQFTQSDVDYAIAHGFLCSVWNVFKNLDGEGYKQYMSMGISGFTDDYNCNSGLNW